MYIITGGAGFIGSAILWQLNNLGIDDILIVDAMENGPKWKNLVKRQFIDIIHPTTFRKELSRWIVPETTAVIHMGACSSTTETDVDFLMDNNVHYSQDVFQACTSAGVPLIYASSAATYGDGQEGFSDEQIHNLRPINPYGYSKQLFDQWVLRQPSRPPFWVGLKFFNVYGPNEYHKGGQASVVFHAYPQVRDQGELKLFKSYREGIAHGDQRRDFIYVKDAARVVVHLAGRPPEAQSGIYNLGTGTARTFADLGRSVFAALSKDPMLKWIEMPEQLRGQYQYFTEAKMHHFKSGLGYQEPFTPLEEGVQDYVQNYLDTEDPYL